MGRAVSGRRRPPVREDKLASRFDTLFGVARGRGYKAEILGLVAAPEADRGVFPPPPDQIQEPDPVIAALDNTSELDADGCDRMAYPRQDLALVHYLDRWESAHGQTADFDMQHDNNGDGQDPAHDCLVYHVMGEDNGADPHLLVVCGDGRIIRSSSPVSWPIPS